MWVRGNGNNAINLDDVRVLIIGQDGSDWVVDAAAIDGATMRLHGTWATEAEAEDAVRRLVDFVDLTTYE